MIKEKHLLFGILDVYEYCLFYFFIWPVGPCGHTHGSWRDLTQAKARARWTILLLATVHEKRKSLSHLICTQNMDKYFIIKRELYWSMNIYLILEKQINGLYLRNRTATKPQNFNILFDNLWYIWLIPQYFIFFQILLDPIFWKTKRAQYILNPKSTVKDVHIFYTIAVSEINHFYLFCWLEVLLIILHSQFYHWIYYIAIRIWWTLSQ